MISSGKHKAKDQRKPACSPQILRLVERAEKLQTQTEPMTQHSPQGFINSSCRC